MIKDLIASTKSLKVSGMLEREGHHELNGESSEVLAVATSGNRPSELCTPSPQNESTGGGAG